MFATCARSVPCSGLASSLGALNTSSSPFFSTLTSGPKRRVSVPSGPFTEISPAPSVTSTLGGTFTGLLPMRDIGSLSSGDDAEHFAADARRARLAIGHDALRCRYDRDAEAVHHARNVVLALVDAKTGLGYPLDLLDHRPAGVIAQRDLEQRLPRLLVRHLEAFVVTLVLQHVGDRDLDLRRRHRNDGA